MRTVGGVRGTTSQRRRWSPTAEQLMVLQELYRRGLRNPNAVQVRTITAHLTLYGKIETKNVFYWFQNHKARDRQKLRKTLNNRQLQFGRPQLLTLDLEPQLEDSCQKLQLLGRSCLDFCSFCHLSPRFSTFLRQTGGVEVDRFNVGLPSYEVGKSMVRMHGGDDWTWMMGTGSSIPRWDDDKTPKTLQLFPLQATDVREQSTTTNSNIPASSC